MDSSRVNNGIIGSEFFRGCLRLALHAYLSYGPDRLLSVSVFGSVHRNEAVPGVSDLDMAVVLRDEFTASDRAWRREAEARLKRELPGFPNLPRADTPEAYFGGLRPGEEEGRRRSLAWAYFLRYDSTLLWGDDPTANLEIPPPDRDWARDRFSGLRDAVRQAAGPCEHGGSGPRESPVLLRKSARSAVLGGAYLLIARGEFRSFKAGDVVPALAAAHPEWASFLETTRSLAVTLPAAEATEPEAYYPGLLAWTDFIGERLEG